MRFVLLALIAITLSACDHIGSTRVKNLIDLTPKLEVEASRGPIFKDAKLDPFQGKQDAYTISKAGIISEPAVAKGVIYSVDNRGYVNAFSLKEKKMLWSRDVSKHDSSFSGGGILYSEGKLYVADGSRYMVVLDADKGHELMRKEFPDIIRTKPVMAANNVLLVQTISNQLVAYDTENSKVLWTHESGMETISSNNQARPVLYNNSVLVNYSSGEVALINVKDGEQQWRYNTSNSLKDIGLPSLNPAVIVTTPIIDGDYAYFATSNGKVVKLAMKSGEAVWEKVANDVQSLIVQDGNVIIANNARQVATLNASDGKVSWVGDLISTKERAAKRPKAITFQKPLIAKNAEGRAIIEVLGSNGELYSFVADGSGRFPASPVITKLNHANIIHYWVCCCDGHARVVTDRKIIFVK